MNCRCGYNGDGEHLCHRCGEKPGTRRFYMPHKKFSLAGMQQKFSVKETYGCDKCWAEFKILLKEQDDQVIQSYD